MVKIEIKKGRSVEQIEFTIQHAPEKEIKIPENEDVRIRLNNLADKNLYQFSQNNCIKGHYSYGRTKLRMN